MMGFGDGGVAWFESKPNILLLDVKTNEPIKRTHYKFRTYQQRLYVSQMI